MITTLLASSAAALGLAALISVDPIIIRKTTVPIFVEFQGYNGNLVGKLLRERIRIIAREAGTVRGESILGYFAEDENAIEVLAEQFKINGVVDAIREFSNLHTYSLDCYLVDRGNDLKFSVKGETALGDLFYISVDGSRDVPTLINKMAERFIERVDPYILAVYHFRKESASRNFSKTLPLIEHSLRVLPIERKHWPLFLWGRIFQLQGDYDGAIAKYQQALALNPDFAFGLIRWGETLLAKGDKEGGLTKMREAMSKPSIEHSPLLYQLLGDALTANGKDDEARDVYVRGLQGAPTNGGLQTSLGALYLRHNQFRPAAELLQSALLQEPKDSRIDSLLPQALSGRIVSSLSSGAGTPSELPPDVRPNP